MRPRIILAIVALAFAVFVARSDGARAVGLGETCAGAGGVGCDAGLWCELDAGACSNAAAEGKCAHAPQMCNMIYMPVCACGGKTYGNDCERRSAKVQKAHNGPCGPGVRSHLSHPSEPDASKNQ
jgi:hypothetical protein